MLIPPMANWRIEDTWYVVDLGSGVQLRVRDYRLGVWQLGITAGGAFTMWFEPVPTLTEAKRAVLERARSSFPACAPAIDELFARLGC